ncbi:MAG: cyclic nucleotide-binding domain-containing protein [Gammaproteobacteria bacterium]|nr:cyclic nucleotide-binding domain-containing protein [Gammaproteobacteria bacterium]
MNASLVTHVPTHDVFYRFYDFSELSEADIECLKKHSRVVNFHKGKSLFRYVNRFNFFYLVAGEVKVKTKTGSRICNAKSTSLERYHALNERADVLSIVTMRPVSILEVDKDVLCDLFALAPVGEYLVEDLAENTNEMNAEGDWMQALLMTKLFNRIPPQNIQKLFSLFNCLLVCRDEVVIEEDAPGDCFYVIKSGSAVVSKRNAEGKVSTLASLSAGDFFGEEALVGNTIRNATITMLADGELMTLEKVDFQELLQSVLLKNVTLSSINSMTRGKRKVVIIDVRMPVEYRTDKHADWLNIPLPVLRNKIPKLDTDTCYVMACNDGQRSRLSAYLMGQAGLDAYILAP